MTDGKHDFTAHTGQSPASANAAAGRYALTSGGSAIAGHQDWSRQPETGPLAGFGEADGFILDQIRGILAKGLTNGGKT